MTLVWVTSDATPGQGCSHPKVSGELLSLPFHSHGARAQAPCTLQVSISRFPTEKGANPPAQAPWGRCSPGPRQKTNPISDVAQNHHSMQPVQSEPREICLCYFLQLIV